MEVLSLYALPTACLLASLTALWLLSLAIRNASIIDIFWGLGFVILAVGVRLQVPGGWHTDALTLMAALWGLRLSTYLAVRNLGHGEDQRYVAIRSRNQPFWWKSYFIVFLLQGTLTLLVGLPLVLGQRPRAAGLGGVGALDLLGMGLFAAGWLTETVADAQLWLYKRDPQHKGQVMTRGLWAYTRHPNYLGEIVLWWGIGLTAVSTPGALVGLLGPLTIQMLLQRVSGVPLLEANMAQRPGYAAYVARTPTLWPRWPKPKEPVA